MCELWYAYCPFDRRKEIVTKNIPNALQWERWNTSAQALWVVRETEARWRSIKDEYPNVSNVEYAETRGPWSSKEPDSLRELVEDVAAILGADVADVLNVRKQHRFEPAWHTGLVEQRMPNAQQATSNSQRPLPLGHNTKFSGVRSNSRQPDARPAAGVPWPMPRA